MRYNKHNQSSLPFNDILLNVILGFIILFTIAFAMINPEAEKEHGNVNLKGAFIIKVEWPADIPDDVDIWVKDPAGNIIFFGRKNAPTLHLDRDDLGSVGEIYIVDGEQLVAPFNREIIQITTALPGEYVVNLFLYKKNVATPVPVTVEITKLEPYQTISINTIILTEQSQEITVQRFTVDQFGEVTDLNNLSVSVVKDVLVTNPNVLDRPAPGESLR